MRTVGLLVLSLVIEGTAFGRGGGFLIPPAEVDIGATSAVGGGGAAVGRSSDVLVGVHFASLAWWPTHLEFGVGYVHSSRALTAGYAGVTTRMSDDGGGGESITADPPELDLSGGYLTLGRTLFQAAHFRTFVELRGELLHARTPSQSWSSLGGAARLAAEVFVRGHGGESDRSGVFAVAGTLAFGFYIEASHRDLANELGPTGVTAGMSIRIPFVLAAVR